METNQTDNTGKISIGKIISLAGVFVSFYMGAAFASGQEMMQFFTAFGAYGIAGLVIVTGIFMFCCIQIQLMAVRERFEDPYQIFTYVLGPRLGKLYVWLMVTIMLCNVVMMTASAGANVSENLGLPDITGRLVAILSAATVCLGLNRITEILGKIGPFIAAAMMVIAAVSILKADLTLSEGIVLSSELDMFRGAQNWLVSALKYGMYCNLCVFSVSVVCGSSCLDRKEAVIAAVAETGLLGTVCMIMMMAQFMNISEICDWQIPNLRLVSLYMPRLAALFSIILLICTFSSVTLQLWTAVRKFQREKTPGYYITTLCIAGAALFISGLFPFSVILNKLFSAGIVIGPVYFAAVLIKTLKMRREKK